LRHKAVNDSGGGRHDEQQARGVGGGAGVWASRSPAQAPPHSSFCWLSTGFARLCHPGGDAAPDGARAPRHRLHRPPLGVSTVTRVNASSMSTGTYPSRTG
jgi:hypothetical protein